MNGIHSFLASIILAGIAALCQAQTPFRWDLPPGVDPPWLPEGVEMTQELVELGRHLFYDKRLSGNGTQACASCHIQALAFTDGRAQGLGSTGALHARSPMSLVNVAYRDALTWANKDMRILEEQALAPMLGEHPVELGMQGHEERIYAELAADARYAELLATAFPQRALVFDRDVVTRALAAFERSIVSFNSPYDRFRFHQDRQALDDAARRGWELFFSERAKCSNCHLAENVSIDLGLNLDGASKTRFNELEEPHFYLFRNTGLYEIYPPDALGLYDHTRIDKDMGRFRTPTLRNVALTAPYMHDGSIATLEEVLEHYVQGGRARSNPLISSSMEPLALSAGERSDLLAFLRSLTDPVVITDPRWSNPWLLAD